MSYNKQQQKLCWFLLLAVGGTTRPSVPTPQNAPAPASSSTRVLHERILIGNISIPLSPLTFFCIRAGVDKYSIRDKSNLQNR